MSPNFTRAYARRRMRRAIFTPISFSRENEGNGVGSLFQERFGQLREFIFDSIPSWFAITIIHSLLPTRRPRWCLSGVTI